MPQSAYPDAEDLEKSLRSLGLFSDVDLEDALEFLDLDVISAAASRQWEEESGWIPFLADAAASARRFDPPGPNRSPQIVGGGYLLEFRAGTISTAPTVISGFSSTSPGTTLTIDTDYWLEPLEASAIARPYTRLRFVVRQWGLERSIQVTARWGYAAQVPDDAWLAILHQGVRIALPEIATRIAGGVVEFSEAGVTERYADGFLMGEKGIGGEWAREWARAIYRYRRIVL